MNSLNIDKNQREPESLKEISETRQEIMRKLTIKRCNTEFQDGMISEVNLDHDNKICIGEDMPTSLLSLRPWFEVSAFEVGGR